MVGVGEEGVGTGPGHWWRAGKIIFGADFGCLHHSVSGIKIVLIPDI